MSCGWFKSTKSRPCGSGWTESTSFLTMRTEASAKQVITWRKSDTRDNSVAVVAVVAVIFRGVSKGSPLSSGSPFPCFSDMPFLSQQHAFSLTAICLIYKTINPLNPAGWFEVLWRLPDSNRPPSDCEPDALPDELNPLSGGKNTTKSLIKTPRTEINSSNGRKR